MYELHGVFITCRTIRNSFINNPYKTLPCNYSKYYCFYGSFAALMFLSFTSLSERYLITYNHFFILQSLFHFACNYIPNTFPHAL